MHLILAPMEGLADYWMRRTLTDTGAFDACVSEFVRVSGSLLPPRVFYRWCPELREGARTRNGTPPPPPTARPANRTRRGRREASIRSRLGCGPASQRGE